MFTELPNATETGDGLLPNATETGDGLLPYVRTGSDKGLPTLLLPNSTVGNAETVDFTLLTLPAPSL